MRIIYAIFLAVLFTSIGFAQVPQKMSYQAVIRNSSGVLVANQTIGMRISILQGSPTGSTVWMETCIPNPQTNANGLVSIEIGANNPLSIEWSAGGPYFLKTETDPAGGTNYTITGTSQLLSVPYALYAGTSGDVNDIKQRIRIVEDALTVNGWYTLTDVDGNQYLVIRIGEQVWMQTNLKTTKLRNGDPIPNISDNSSWAALSTPAYCWYNNDISNKEVYGAMYNWNTINTNLLCPAGWHVPSESDWTTLTTFLGDENNAGGRLKEQGTTHWSSPNTNATGDTQFHALPGGFRDPDGNFDQITFTGYWWSSTSINSLSSWLRGMFYNSGELRKIDADIKSGCSVRCIRDN